jgi:alpha-beta hydrolase superfamily lysophospholipase
LKVEEHRWVLHHFDVTASRGTVLLVHGYFDHALTWSDYIDHLTEQNWSVAALDLPGHGHSSGERAGIDDFATYHRALKAAIEALVDRSTPADAIVAHSTGAGVVMETLFTHEAAPLAPRIVLVAPLVRSAGWDVGRKAYQLGGHRMQGVPRVFTPSSADEDFTARLRSDPLQAGWVPSSFLGAVYAWHDRMANYPPSHADVLVLQGEDDRTLEWSYNLRFIADKLPRAHVYRIPRGRHHLVFDAEPMRSRVRVAIDDWIK